MENPSDNRQRAEELEALADRLEEQIAAAEDTVKRSREQLATIRNMVKEVLMGDRAT